VLKGNQRYRLKGGSNQGETKRNETKRSLALLARSPVEDGADRDGNNRRLAADPAEQAKVELEVTHTQAPPPPGNTHHSLRTDDVCHITVRGWRACLLWLTLESERPAATASLSTASDTRRLLGVSCAACKDVPTREPRETPVIPTDARLPDRNTAVLYKLMSAGFCLCSSHHPPPAAAQCTRAR
jgi:hypothetical protein